MPNTDNKSDIDLVDKNINIEKNVEIQKELFLATLTHDLKTPLQAQISSLKLLSKGGLGDINKSQKEVIDMIIESACFMREMLYSILLTYKYEKGMVKLNKRSFDIDTLINLCLKETLYLAKEKNIEIEYRNFALKSILNADESQIRRVISNILNNSINYAYKNTKIFICLQEDKDTLKIKIRNTSAIIPDNIKKHIFEKYVSGSDLSQRSGVGLGLYFCKKVVDAHCGKISLNGLDTSNEFVIELPKFDNEMMKEKLTFV